MPLNRRRKRSATKWPSKLKRQRTSGHRKKPRGANDDVRILRRGPAHDLPSQPPTRQRGEPLIPSHHDPERSALFDMQKLRIDQCWRKGEIENSTYLRSLFIMGYSPADANVELNLLRMEE